METDDRNETRPLLPDKQERFSVPDLLLLRWEEAQERGEDLSPEDLCRDYPEHLSAIRRGIGKLREVRRVLDSGSEQIPGRSPEVRPTIAGYEILGELARGGMGVVYEARHRVLEQTRAIKVMSPRYAVHPEALRRFEREMKVLAQLEHPNIVPVFEAGLANDQPYFVMPLIRGGSLTDHLPALHADIRAAVALMEQVARAVHHAHQGGILHRDLKPGNILLTEDGRPIVTDFGLAKLFSSEPETELAEPTRGSTDEETPIGLDANATPIRGERSTAGYERVSTPEASLNHLTKEGRLVGTPPYMAPEQLSGQISRIGPTTDVWALGVITYRLLAGALPHEGSDPLSLLQQIHHAPPVSPRSIRPEVDSVLASIVLRCLRPEPRDRYPSAQALAGDLGAWLRNERIVGVPEGWRRRLKRQVQRWWVPASLVALLLLALGVGLRFTPLFRPPQPAPAADPDAAREQAYQKAVAPFLKRLAQSQPVTPVGGPGHQPAWRWRLGSGKVERRGKNGEELRVTVHGVALLELLPKVPAGGCRIEAKLQHVEALNDPWSFVGCYGGYSEYQNEQGANPLLLPLTFADVGPSANAIRLNGQLFTDFHGGVLRPRGFVLVNQRKFKDPPLVPNPVRTLVLELDQDSIRAFWDGERSPFVQLEGKALHAREEAFSKISRLKPGLENLTVTFPPSGAVGIYVDGAVVDVKEFQVIPLEDNHPFP
jgi:serine/threonine protein kinase